MGRIVLAYKLGEFRVGGRDLVFHRAFDLCTESFPVNFTDGVWKLAQRIGERTFVERIVGNLLRLAGHFLEQILAA